MRHKYKKIKDKKKEMAKKVITKLFKFVNAKDFNLQESNVKISDSLKTNYLNLIRKISMKFKIKLTKTQKLKYCKKCKQYLNPLNSKHRIKNQLKITCNHCGYTKNITTKKN